MSYSGNTLQVTITDTVTNQSVSQTYTVDLPAKIGSDTAYVGLDGGTGELSSLQDVLTWTSQSNMATLEAPTNLAATFFTPAEIDLGWQCNSDNEAGFQVERSTDGVNFTPIAVTEPNVTSYRDLGLTPGDYAYRVRAFNAQGHSVYSNTLRVRLAGEFLSQDIGGVKLPGSAAFAEGTYTVTASGDDIFYHADSFHYAHKPLTGDGEIVARVASIQASDYWSKAGVMIRESLDPGARNVMIGLTPPPHHEAFFQRRPDPDGASVSDNAGAGTATAPYWVRLVRSGNNFAGYGSADGVNWVQVGPTVTIAMPDSVRVGLAVTSHHNTVLNTSSFDQVKVTQTILPATHLGVRLPGRVAAGTSFPVTITALDANNQRVTSYLGTVQLTSTDLAAMLLPAYTFTAADAGAHTFMMTLETPGNQTITANDAAGNGIAGSSLLNVQPGAGAFLVTGFPSPVAAGGYRGTVHFTGSDGQALLPLDYFLTALDVGAHPFDSVWITTGTPTHTATDVMLTGVTGSPMDIVVTPLEVGNLVVLGFPPPIMTGISGTCTVTATDIYGPIAADYTGTITFGRDDGQVDLPLDYSFGGSDNGVHSANATLTTGAQSLTASDMADSMPSETQAGVVVETATAGRLVVSGFPSPITAGMAGTVTVSVQDAHGQIASRYTGTIIFRSSDDQAVLPDDYTFTPDDNGVHTFPVILKTVGTQAITATDKATGFSGTQDRIEVDPAPALQNGPPVGANVAFVTGFGIGLAVAEVPGPPQPLPSVPQPESPAPVVPSQKGSDGPTEAAPAKPPSQTKVVDEFFTKFEDRAPYNPFLD
jgi:hypothetical protein